MRDASPMGVHQRISDAPGLPEGASPVHHPASDALDLAVRLLARQGAAPIQPLPACTACGSPVDDPGDALCGACYAARRGPGRVLTFDPDRRRRTLARLAGRPCGTCGAVAWRVNARGDATCRGCFPSSPPAGSAPDAPSASKLSGPDRGGVSRGGPA